MTGIAVAARRALSVLAAAFAAGACTPDSNVPKIDSTIEQKLGLPAINPGDLLGVSAPGYGLSTGWDLTRNRVIIGEQKLYAVDLTSRAVTTLYTPPIALTPAITYLSVAPDGAIVWTSAQMDGTDVLQHLVPPATQPVPLNTAKAQSFALSENGRWIIVRELNVLARIDRQSGERSAIQGTSGAPLLAIDDEGRRVAERLCNGSTPSSACTYSVRDLVEGVSHAVVDLPLYEGAFGGLVPQIRFSGATLVVLRARAEGSQSVIYEWDEATGSERILGKLGPAVDISGTWCTAWSPATHSVVIVRPISPALDFSRSRFGVFALANGEARMIRNGDLFQVVGCSLSPDGKWFVYGNATGYLTGPSRWYYLTAVP